MHRHDRGLRPHFTRQLEKWPSRPLFPTLDFAPLASEELDDLDLEISVLTPLERIKDPGQIEIGRHGLLIRKKSYSGLLLPQVATEQGWDRYQFLEATCRKASLPPAAWKEKSTEIYVFSADIF